MEIVFTGTLVAANGFPVKQFEVYELDQLPSSFKTDQRINVKPIAMLGQRPLMVKAYQVRVFSQLGGSRSDQVVSQQVFTGDPLLFSVALAPATLC